MEGSINGQRTSIAADQRASRSVRKDSSLCTLSISGRVGTNDTGSIDSEPETLRLADNERGRVLFEFNDTAIEFARDSLVHELFERQAARTPSSVAVMHGERRLSFAELNCHANQLARYLVNQGAGPDKVVGICVERSLDLIVGVLGVLKAGAAYLPLDPNYPVERVRNMVSDSTPIIIFAQTEWLTVIPDNAVAIDILNSRLRDVASYIADDLSAAELGGSSRNLVYVIYTSGSTGRPKGIAMTHRSMVNLIEWHRRSFGSAEGKRVLQFAALSFDVAFQEIFTTLCTGGTLVLLDEWIRRDVRALRDLLQSHSIERLFLPPMMLQTLAEHAHSTGEVPVALKDVICAGEQLRISLEVRDFFKKLPNGRLHNHYGPTETHVVTALTLTGDPEQWPTLPDIGRPIANTQIYILDEQRRPVPIGVAGEIYIGGVGVAREYLHRLELTAQRFVLDPYSCEPGARLYKTGDLGRWRADGHIEYLGRADDQVKVRGYRIELGEITEQLSRYEKVKEAAVVAREDALGEKRLVAYVVPREAAVLRIEELRTYLKTMLPEFMLPSAFVMLKELPSSPNGKLDRKVLPAPTHEAYVRQGYEAPVGEQETLLAEIWQELLRVDRVGRHDNFFELGGHSLLVLRAVSSVNARLDAKLKVADMYGSPTLRGLAACILRGSSDDPLIDLSREANLSRVISPLSASSVGTSDVVMLTGATGFVGRFLLTRMLEQGTAKIYCLVRASSGHQALTRIKQTLMKWNLWRSEFEDRIAAVSGDLRLPRLGLEDGEYQTLCREVGTIYHCGTSMNHLETYASAKSANVQSANEILKIATQGRAKIVNYISTLGVFSNVPRKGMRVVNERSSIDRELHRNSSGYLASKWVAEKLFMTAQARGIPCNIFRLGLVWADAAQGRFDELQYLYRLIKSCLLSGYAIQEYRFEMNPTPVDYVARAISCLGSRHIAEFDAFHISSPWKFTGGLFERYNDFMVKKTKIVPYFEWISEMKRLHLQGKSMPIVPLIEFAFSMEEGAFYRYLQDIPWVRISFDCNLTSNELERAGTFAPVLNDDLLRVCLEDMMRRDARISEHTKLSTQNHDEHRSTQKEYHIN